MAPSERRPRPAQLGLILILFGLVWAGVYDAQSASWDPRCYALNVCDSLTFRVAAELLEAERSPYDEAARRSHVSSSRLDGASVPFDLPFQYPPNALPLIALRGFWSPRVAHLVHGIVTTLLFFASALLLIRRDVAEPETAGFLLGGLIFSGAATFNVQLGQTGALAAALVIGAVLVWHRFPL